MSKHWIAIGSRWTYLINLDSVDEIIVDIDPSLPSDNIAPYRIILRRYAGAKIFDTIYASGLSQEQVNNMRMQIDSITDRSIISKNPWRPEEVRDERQY